MVVENKKDVPSIIDLYNLKVRAYADFSKQFTTVHYLPLEMLLVHPEFLWDHLAEVYGMPKRDKFLETPIIKSVDGFKAGEVDKYTKEDWKDILPGGEEGQQVLD